MDYNTEGIEEAAPPRRPGAIFARSIANFFANKCASLSDESKTPSSDDASMDVHAVLQDVDELLDHRSIEDGRLLLRGMVADLLKEMDVLRYQFDTLQEQYRNVKEERDLVNHEYNDRIYALTVALNRVVLQSSSEGMEATTVLTDALKEKVKAGQVLTADEATAMTIQSLTERMALLHTKNTQLYEEMQLLQEQVHDLTSDNQAKVYKILALEKQFLNINTKRNKVVTKYNKPEKKSPLLILRPLSVPDRSPVAPTPQPPEEESVNHHHLSPQTLLANLMMQSTSSSTEEVKTAVEAAVDVAPVVTEEAAPSMVKKEEAIEVEPVTEETKKEEEDPVTAKGSFAATPSLIEWMASTASPPPTIHAEKASLLPHPITPEAATKNHVVLQPTTTTRPNARRAARGPRLVKLVEQV